jgi:hypothetical protein
MKLEKVNKKKSYKKWIVFILFTLFVILVFFCFLTFQSYSANKVNENSYYKDCSQLIILAGENGLSTADIKCEYSDFYNLLIGESKALESLKTNKINLQQKEQGLLIQVVELDIKIQETTKKLNEKSIKNIPKPPTESLNLQLSVNNRVNYLKSLEEMLVN